MFILHELEGMPPADIASLVDCPVLTVRTRLFYARKELAQLMRTEPALAGLAAQGERRTRKRKNDSAEADTQDSTRSSRGEVTRPATLGDKP